MKDRSSTETRKVCANPACERQDIRARGRCQACYVFLRRHGRDVQPEEMRSRRPERPCGHCGQRPIRARGRCRICYQYWLRTGRERPLHRRDGLCAICGERRVFRQDRCRTCYAYRRQYGKDRSATREGGGG